MDIFGILDQKHRPTPPTLSYEDPGDEAWLALHRQAMGALDTFREMGFFIPFYFFHRVPDVDEVVMVFVQKERSGEFSVTAYFFDPFAADATHLPPMFHLLEGLPGSLGASQYASLTLTSKKYLTDADLALRERLGIPSPGRKRFAWPRFREKREGFAEGRLGRHGADILRTSLMLFERLAEKKTPRQLANSGPCFFHLDEGAQPDRPSSWKLRSVQGAAARAMDPMLPESFGDDAEPEAEDMPVGPGVWHVDLVAADALVPCSGGMFHPLLFLVMEAGEEDVALLGGLLLSPADDNESCIAECFRETLDRAKKPPRTVVFSKKTALPPLLSECASRDIETVEAPPPLPYTKWFTEELADVPREALHKVFGIETEESRVATVRIELEGARPRIYRDLRLPGETTLVQLHRYIQEVFDWDDSHLYDFSVSRGRMRSLFPKFGSGEDGLPSELAATLQSLHDQGIRELTYIYDYGDDWEHKITIRSIKSAKKGEPAPALIGGEGAAPPEDCGGIYNFCHLRRKLESAKTQPDPEEDDDWLLQEIADASFEFTGETLLPVASNKPPPQNYEQDDGFFGF